MSKKKLKKDGVYFTGEASDDVTGSQYLVRVGDVQCLLECGLHQSSKNNHNQAYRINSAKFKFKPSEISYVFVAHPHIDHCGLLPRLVREGFHGKIIATSNTAKIMIPLLYNSAYIHGEEAKMLSKQAGYDYKPIYTPDDVYKMLPLIEPHDEYDKEITLDDNVRFTWFKNSHCIGAAQLLLSIGNDSSIRKILYTSDLGALKSSNHFLCDTVIPTRFADVAIMESTYGDSKRQSHKTRADDNEHLRAAIRTTLDRGGTVIMPCFSFARTQELLATIYDLFADNDSFRAPVVVDSLLTTEITKLYEELLDGEDRQYWKRVIAWKNVELVPDSERSREWIADRRPKIVLSSSGFCTNGRVVNYLKKYLCDKNSMIIFSGYVGDNPTYLSYRIKNFRSNKTISINKEQVPNRADCISLASFSSHANYKDLLRYGSSINTNKLVLVHGSKESKDCLAEGLRAEISKQNKTYKAIPAHKGLIVSL